MLLYRGQVCSVERRLLGSLARGMFTERPPGKTGRTLLDYFNKTFGKSKSALQLGDVYRNNLGRRVQDLVQIRSVDQSHMGFYFCPIDELTKASSRTSGT